MKEAISFIICLILLALAAMHLYWGLGGKWGGSAVLPTKEDGVLVFKPRLLECLVVVLVLFFVILFIGIKIQIITIALPQIIFNYGLKALACLFFLRAVGDFKYVGFFKSIKNTSFAKADTQYYSPFCVLFGILFLSLDYFVSN